MQRVQQAVRRRHREQWLEIPDEVGDNWHVDEYDGFEHVAENHRTWS